MTDATTSSTEAQLAERLTVLQPDILQIVNESSGHGGYYPGKESHFKVTLVSPVFEGLRSVQRHQKVYAAAGDLLSPGMIHALAIHAYAPQEWQGQSVDSPACAHAK
jgi:BolA protein